MRYRSILVVVWAAATACGDAEPKRAVAAPQATPVTVVAAEPAAAGSRLTGTGAVAPKDEIPLAFKIGGVVAEVLVDEGAEVARGQTLARLDLREIDAAVTRAVAAADKAQRDLARAERLFRDSVVTQTQLLDTRTARDVAEADVRAARVNREFAVIVAPARGRVLKRSLQPGMMAAPGMTALTLASGARGLVLRVGMADRDALQVRVGQPAEIAFDALPGRAIRGQVRLVSPSADPRTGAITVEVALPDGEELPIGLIGRVSITTSARALTGLQGAQRVPAESLVEGDDSTGTLFVVDSGSSIARRTAVTLVGLSGDHVLVRGLAPRARVVVAGASWLRDSARVEVRP